MLSPFLSLTFAQVVGRARTSARVAVVEDGGSITAFLPFELSAGDRSQQRVRRLEAAGLLTGRAVRKRRAQRRALEREIGDVSLAWSSSDPKHMRLMMDWKSDKYHASRELFSDRSAVQIVEELAAARHPQCTGVLNVLSAGGRAVAVHFGIVGPQGLCWWFPTYDREIGRFSPGIMLLMAVAEEAAARQIPSVDLGYGQDSWKFSLATQSYAVAGGGLGDRVRGRSSRPLQEASQ